VTPTGLDIGHATRQGRLARNPPAPAAASPSRPSRGQGWYRYDSDGKHDRRSLMDLQLTAEQLEFKKLAREFLEAEVIPNRQEWDRQEEVDPAIVPKLGEIGFFGLTIPEEYGGLGGDWITYCIGMEELGRADSAVRGIVSVSMGLCGKIILVHGSEEQKQRWLPGIANGTKVGCFGLTEPDNGSDPGHLKTRAKRDGNEWVINGSKIFITNATIADVALVFARTGGEGARGISAFLVPTDTPGFERNLIHGKLGLRGQATAELSFNDVRVPADALVGEEGKGFKYAMESLDKGRISVAAGCVGIVQACLEACVDYAKSRAQFGKPIASYQLVQDMIAEISVDADAARLLAWRAADLVERGLPFGTAASKAKLFASEAAVKAANLAISRAVPSASRTALGAAAIAKRLTADGYRTKAGNPWSQAAVLVVLRNRTYLGEIWFRDRWYKAEDHHPAIISEKLFDQAQDILDARGDAITHRAVANSDYYLAGRLFCSHCGKRYLGTAANGNKYRYRYYTLNRPGLVGVSIVWKRGWTHAEGHHPGEADHASLQPRREGRCGADGQDAACRARYRARDDPARCSAVGVRHRVGALLGASG